MYNFEKYKCSICERCGVKLWRNQSFILLCYDHLDVKYKYMILDTAWMSWGGIVPAIPRSISEYYYLDQLNGDRYRLFLEWRKLPLWGN